MLFLVILIISLATSNSIPILSADDQKLNSIVIIEYDFTTEHPLLVVDTEISAIEPEKSFTELIERYDEMFIKSNSEDQQNVRKRNSEGNKNEEDEMEGGGGGKSLIEKIEIEDPDVRKEFEIEISKQSSMASNVDDEDTTENSQLVGTDYEPNYAKKIYENSTKLTIHEKEVLQVHLVEQLVNSEVNNSEYTTIVPEESLAHHHHELVKDPEIVEVLEHINYESGDELKAHEHTTMVNVVNMDFDPIEIIPKDRHRMGKTDEEPVTDNNDKFAGFVGIPVEDLEKPGEEVTERDHFFPDTNKKKEEDIVGDIVNAEVDVLREALEIVAIYGKSLKIDASAREEDSITTTILPVAETEMIETKTSPTVDDSSEEEKSSEESGEKLRKIDSSEEENQEAPKKLNSLTEELLFKESNTHEVKKKDHPDGLALPSLEIDRKFLDDTSRQFNDGGLIDAKTQATITTIYETAEEVLTTISDGIKLSNELRSSVQSFRDNSKEVSSVLDTLRETVSAKIAKNPMVVLDVAENRQLSENKPEFKVSMMSIVTVIALVSLIVLIGLFAMLKKRSERGYFV